MNPDPDAAVTTLGPVCSRSLAHEALFYSCPESFLAGVLPFLREGLGAGEPILAALVPPKITAVRRALGADADRVTYVDLVALGANPACVLPVWRTFAAENARRPRLRGIGEPIWAARPRTEIAEAQLHEQVLNVAFGPGPELVLRCAYDAAALPADVVAEARRSHPVLVEAGSRRDSPDFTGSAGVLAAFRTDLPAVPPDADRQSFTGGRGLRAVREMVVWHADVAGLRAERTHDLVLSVSELAANSLLHGGGSGVLSVWQAEGRVVCDVRDPGRIDDPLVGRVLPPHDAEGGRGLWLANRLCDLVQVRSTRTGTVARVHMAIGRRIPAARPAS